MISIIFALMTAPSLAHAGPMFNRLFVAVHQCRNTAAPGLRKRTVSAREFLNAAGFLSNQAVFSKQELFDLTRLRKNGLYVDVKRDLYFKRDLTLKNERKVQTKHYLNALLVTMLSDDAIKKLRDFGGSTSEIEPEVLEVLSEKSGPLKAAEKIDALPFRIATFLANAPGLNVQGWTKLKNSGVAWSWYISIHSLISDLTHDFQSVATKHFPIHESSASEELQKISASTLMKMAIDFSVLRFIEEELFGSAMWVDGTFAPWMFGLNTFAPQIILARPRIVQFFNQIDQSPTTLVYRNSGERAGRQIEIRTPKEFYNYLDHLLWLAQNNISMGRSENLALKQLEQLVELRLQLQI